MRLEISGYSYEMLYEMGYPDLGQLACAAALSIDNMKLGQEYNQGPIELLTQWLSDQGCALNNERTGCAEVVLLNRVITNAFKPSPTMHLVTDLASEVETVRDSLRELISEDQTLEYSTPELEQLTHFCIELSKQASATTLYPYRYGVCAIA